MRFAKSIFIFLLVSIPIIWEEMSLEPVDGTAHMIIQTIMIHTIMTHSGLIHTLVISIITGAFQERDHETATETTPETTI